MSNDDRHENCSTARRRAAGPNVSRSATARAKLSARAPASSTGPRKPVPGSTRSTSANDIIPRQRTDFRVIYRDDDFIFTRVIVPAQQIDGGVVRLDVIEAVIETATIEEPGGEIGPVRALAEEIVAPLVGLTNPTGALLERVLFTLNEVPGITRATAVPQTGEGGRGALALFVNVERDPFEGTIYADNRQTTGVGRGIVGVTATYNSWSSAGDTTTLSLFNSLDFDDGNLDLDERNTAQLTHQRHLNGDGLVLRGRALYSRTRPGDDLAPTGIEGSQYLFALGLRQPIVSSRKLITAASLDLEFSGSTTDVSNGDLRVADDNLRVVALGVEGIRRDALGYTSFEASIRQGVPIFGESRGPAQGGNDELSRGDGRSDFTLVRGEIERELIINEDLSLLVKAAGQYSFTPLLAGEEFSIGGTTFGRGYDPSQFSGDHGLGIAAELKYLKQFTIEDMRFAVEPYFFADIGMIGNLGVGDPAFQTLGSTGGGFRFYLPEDIAIGIEVTVPMVKDDQLIENTPERLFINFTKRL